jgi:hypothetical protein
MTPLDRVSSPREYATEPLADVLRPDPVARVSTPPCRRPSHEHLHCTLSEFSHRSECVDATFYRTPWPRVEPDATRSVQRSMQDGSAGVPGAARLITAADCKAGSRRPTATCQIHEGGASGESHCRSILALWNR